MGASELRRGPNTVATVGLLGQFLFPTTGVMTEGKATLLAIDDASLPLKRNLCYYITKPTVRKEPVLVPRTGDPNAPDNLATHFYGTVLYEQGRFRMWYYPCSRSENREPRLGPICYAESADGIRWERPDLGQVEFNGSRKNNALDLPGGPMTNATLILDDDDPDPSRRYKLVYNTGGPTVPWSFRTATSPDGIHWKASPDCVVKSFAEQSSFYEHNGLYIVNTQAFSPGQGGHGRGRIGVAWVSPDFDNWLQESAESFALPDPQDAGKPLEHVRRDEVHLGVGAASLGNVCVGLYCIWHNDEDFGKISGDLGLVVSNDGIAFREPIKGYVWLRSTDSIPAQVPGKNYQTILCQANGILNVGEETRIYHGRWRNVNYHDPAVDAGDYYAEVALATIPRDRWGALGLFPDATEGSVWSCPVTLPDGGCELRLNADGAEGMRVEVADERFNPLRDFSGELSGTPTASGGLEVPVKWPRANLAQLSGKTVRFRVQVNKVAEVEPRLYAIYLQAPPNAPTVPMAQHEAEEFTVRVGDRTVTARILSPPTEKLAEDPALLISFAGDRNTSLLVAPYCRPPQHFLAHGHRALSFDLPAHGERVDPRYGEQITGWRSALVAGVDPFAALVEDGKAVIDECIRRGWAKPGRIAVCGTSRGGYMALRLLAADPRIAAGAAFAPVTDLRALAEFAADRDRQDVADLRLSRFAPGLVGRPLFLAIGSNDERVSTESCRQLAETLKRAEERVGISPTQVWYGETDDVGHTLSDRWYVVGQQFLLRSCTK